jgi:hypothetical protein
MSDLPAIRAKIDAVLAHVAALATRDDLTEMRVAIMAASIGCRTPRPFSTTSGSLMWPPRNGRS